MEKQSECYRVKDAAGKVLLSIYPGKDVLIEQRMDGEPVNGKNGSNGNGGNGKHGGNGNGNGNGEGMTFPQKKFLYRILAGQGIEGDTAHTRLKELFKVDHLKDVGKMEASRMIERLLRETKGDNGHGSSVS